MRSSLLLLCWSINFIGVAQTGPGGVGNSSSNVLWLDASYGVTAPTLAVSAWADRSGNGNNAAQTNTNRQPAYVTGTVNGYPAIQFDNDQTDPDMLRIPDNSTLEGMSGLTSFCVYQFAAGTALAAPRAIFTKRNSPDGQEAYAWFHYNGGGAGATRYMYLDIDGTGNRINSSAAFVTGTTYLNSFVYSGSAPSNASDQVLYNGNASIGNGIETSASIPNYASDLYIGNLRGHTGSGTNTSRFNGWMSEVIMYNQALGPAQRTIVNNYLSAKYDVPIATLDLYTQDQPASGDYDHEVAGIGRSNSDSQTDSRGSGMVGISNASNLDVDEYLLWGHDNGNASGWGASADVPAGVQARLTRVWRVSELNTASVATDVGAVDITFHLTGFAGVFAANLRLLVDANNNGVFADDAAIGGAVALGSGRYTFPGTAALSDRVRFTIGTIQSDTALPIELVAFAAEAIGDHVRLDWTTATELNNERFTVERSADTDVWNPVVEVAGAGNSSSAIAYDAIDSSPLSGTSFYRLRQTDNDGTSSLSGIRSVVRGGTNGRPLVVPNPAQGDIIVSGMGTAAVQVIDATGRIVAIGFAAAAIDISALPNGLYHVRTERSGARAEGVPFVVQH